MFLVLIQEPYEVCIQKNILKMNPLSTQNICCEYSKEPSEIHVAPSCTQNTMHFDKQENKDHFFYTLNVFFYPYS